jgi:hypothetical protein
VVSGTVPVEKFDKLGGERMAFPEISSAAGEPGRSVDGACESRGPHIGPRCVDGRVETFVSWMTVR